jgi:hypothetical protein
MRRAVITVVTADYLDACVTMFRSLARTNDALDMVCYVLDASQQGEWLRITDEENGEGGLSIRMIGWDRFCNERLRLARDYMDAFELSCAAKAPAIRHAMEVLECDEVVYLDSDFYCCGSLAGVLEELGNCEILLTPHCLVARDKLSGRSDSYCLMRVGLINAGFMAVRRSARCLAILEWLEERVMRYGFNEPEASLFVDQKWVSVLPLVFPHEVALVEHFGINVGHWNLHERPLQSRDGIVSAAGEPLILFHFSGFDRNSPQSLTRYAHRPVPTESKDTLSRLCDRYAADLAAAVGSNSGWSVDRPIAKRSFIDRLGCYEKLFGGSICLAILRRTLAAHAALEKMAAISDLKHRKCRWSQIASIIHRIVGK